MSRISGWKAACAIFLLCAATAVAAPAQTFTDLTEFGTIGTMPYSAFGLVQGTDGNFYGTTELGGGYGTILKITPGGTPTTLYHFCSQGCGGYYPRTGLILATDGNFYGMLEGNDLWCNGCGSVFRITPVGKLTTIYNLCPQMNSCPDGAEPDGLVQATDANIYGLAETGGVPGPGTVFRLSLGGKLTTVYSFCSQANCTDGYYPAGLTQATDGNFYGTTSDGGNLAINPSYGCGTVFKITPAGKLTTLHVFGGDDGCAPQTGLVQAADGNFYGVATHGGSTNSGTVFKITPGGKLTTLHVFCLQTNCPDGEGPTGLVQGTDGNLYGTTEFGGGGPCASYSDGCGTIFEVTPNGVFTTLHRFAFSDGWRPGPLLQATDGNLYGTTWWGGHVCKSPGCGIAFRLSMGLSPFVSFIRASGVVGRTVQILGQGFTGTSSVSFNGTPAAFTVKSDTYLTATVPAGATTGFVTVTTPGGTLKSNKTFRVTPQITNFSPTSGPVGTSVVITGHSFTGTTAVTFALQKKATFTVDSDTQITATVPAGATTGVICVWTAGGNADLSTVFTVTP